MKKGIGLLSVMLIVLADRSCLPASIIYPLEIFTSNGDYHDGSGLNLYVELTGRAATVDFGFHNDSLVDSSIARIYVEDTFLLGDGTIIEGPGTSFTEQATPANIPGGQMLIPPVKRTSTFSIAAAPQPAHAGINPGEFVKVTFDLSNNATFADVAGALNGGDFRIGVHIIALPDGSSESAVNIPEPATLLLIGFGAVMVRRSRKRIGRIAGRG